jgi:hypothetical protein
LDVWDFCCEYKDLTDILLNETDKMNKSMLLILLILMTFGCVSQNKINLKLKAELDSILVQDQQLREYWDNQTPDTRREEISKLTGYSREYLDKNLGLLMEKIDSTNLIKVENIIKQYGYPGKSIVGEPTNTAAFLVIQHSPKISKYFPLIEKAGKDGELAFIHVAKMLDRKLIEEGKEQIYGTQLEGKLITNEATGKKEQFIYVLPIKNPEFVNERRKKAGFETTVEQNASRLGIEYKIYTYKELQKIN